MFDPGLMVMEILRVFVEALIIHIISIFFSVHVYSALNARLIE